MYLSREMMADGILTKTAASNDWITVALLSKVIPSAIMRCEQSLQL